MQKLKKKPSSSSSRMDMIRMTLSQGAFDLIEEEKILPNILHYDLYRMEREGSEGGKGRESRGRPGGNRVKGKKIGGGLVGGFWK